MIKFNKIKNKILHKIFDGKIAKLPYPPSHITLLVEGRCTNNCIFCCHHSLDAKINKYTKHMYNFRYSMTLPEFQKIVYMAFRAKVPHIHICGTGEPFLNKHIIEMMDYLIKLYGYCSFQSNLNKNLMKKYLPEIIKRAKYISFITTDLHSSDPNFFGKTKKGSDYNHILDCLAQLTEQSEVKPLFNISYILTKQNYKGIDKLIDDLIKTKAKFKLNINNLHPYEMNDFTKVDNLYHKEDIEITMNMRIAQMLIQPVVSANLEETEDLEETARGEGGFGATGTH